MHQQPAERPPQSEGFNSRFDSKHPLLSGILYLPPQPLSEVVMSFDPRVLESWAHILDVRLSFSRVAAEGAGGRRHNARLEERCGFCNALAKDWRICFFFAEGCILSNTLPSVSLPWSDCSSQAAVRGRAGVPASSPERFSFQRRACSTHCVSARCTRSSRTLASHSTHLVLCRKWTASGSRSRSIGRLSTDSAASVASESAISFSGSALWARTLINRVIEPAAAL